MNAVLSRPYRNLSLLGNVDEWFDNVFTVQKRPVSKSHYVAPAVDVFETDNAYLITTDLPGIDKDNLLVSVADNVLVIEATTKKSSETKADHKVVKSERYSGTYKHTFKLDNSVSADEIKADYRDGVLEITLPKSKQSGSRVIEVARH